MKTFDETVNWMFTQLPMYQRQGKTAFKKDLTNISALSGRLGNPHYKFKTIHVGGTNGKGSTSHMIASILQEAGYKVGLYTSPHLKSFTERIRINGEEIPEDYVVEFIEGNRTFLENQRLSFFEMTVGLAFDYFAKEEVDIAVIEVGLGGRLDSTNIITPEVSVITNIGWDHMDMLGDTLPKIAFEKAGIIKPNVPVVIGERQKAVEQVFLDKAKECIAKITFASDSDTNYQTDLLGDYQKKNAKTAAAALEKLVGFDISNEQIATGLQNVVRNTNLKGRWQILGENPKIICDTAHNKEGLQMVMNQLKSQSYEELHIVLGVVADKKLKDILTLFPKEANYYFCKPDVPRGLPAAQLKEEALHFGFEGDVYESVTDALLAAKRKSKVNDVIYVGGSTFVVAEVV
ncbi:MAG: tetrahydrofolate synthase [Flavobacteriaceae bacterium]|nr:tetrahydrofolate synthase [Flavobacteriaceae bacterium]|tara:strand:- start:29044 stop:30255 length:1212 start_codon:yes stop_codon:yes gene_type:complete